MNLLGYRRRLDQCSDRDAFRAGRPDRTIQSR